MEALQEEQILDEIEIKQEIVLDPNEWVLLGFYWIGAEFLMILFYFQIPTANHERKQSSGIIRVRRR